MGPQTRGKMLLISGFFVVVLLTLSWAGRPHRRLNAAPARPAARLSFELAQPATGTATTAPTATDTQPPPPTNTATRQPTNTPRATRTENPPAPSPTRTRRPTATRWPNCFIFIEGPGGRTIQAGPIYPTPQPPGYEYRYAGNEYLPDDVLGPWQWSVVVTCPEASDQSKARII